MAARSIITAVRVEGMRAAKANAIALERLTTGSMRLALTKAARPMLRKAKSTVSVDTGLLKKSLKMKVTTYKRQRAVAAVIGSDKKVMSVVDGKKKRPARYIHLVEFGHGGPHPAPPKPFLRPAYESEKANAQSIFEREMGPAIEKTAARLARTSFQPGRR